MTKGKRQGALTQEEAEQRLKYQLKGTPYVLKSPLNFETVNTTYVDLHCTLHDYDWRVSYHELIYHSRKRNTFGCKFCKLKYPKDLCHNAALRCKHRSEFAKKYKGEYFSALRNGWLDEICNHMEVLGNRYRRCIYAYEFPDVNKKKYVYVGLTDHLTYRDNLHGVKGSVYSFCQKHKISRPKPIQLTEYLCVEEATVKEGFFLSNYIASGWIPINKVKTGGLGGHLSNDGFTFEECKIRGQRFSKRSEWKQEDYPTYYIAHKRGWLNLIMKQKERFGNGTQTFWTKDKIHETALNYKFRSEFCRKSPVAYMQARKLGILDAVCNHMSPLWKPTGYTVEMISLEIEKYETLTDFINHNPSMYNWIIKHKIKLCDISDKPYKKPKGNPKPVIQFTKEGVFVRRYNNARETEIYGFNFKNVSQVCKGERKSHKGFIFRFE